jgi:hypothetical protein
MIDGMRSTSLAFAIAIAAASAPARAEFCGSMGLEARVVTSADLVVPGDGGVLVAALPGIGQMEGDAANQPTWHFQSRGKSTKARRTTLAPGLVVYEAREDGSVALVDDQGKTRATAFVTHRARPRLPAPVVKWVTRAPDAVNVFLELDALPPGEAVAIVTVGKDGKARSWDFIDSDSTSQRAFKQRGCEMAPPGTLTSAVGDSVTFFFVDLYGRRSGSSRPMKIVDRTPSERAITPQAK